MSANESIPDPSSPAPIPVANFGDLHVFENFEMRVLAIESEALKGNALGDPVSRRNPVLVPKGEAPKAGWPVVLALSGFTGNGPNAFNIKTLEENMPQAIDRLVARGEAPLAVYAFCDAMTRWGGSQFIDSEGTGRYETYVARELVGALKARLPVSEAANRWCAMGGSSGGYGALSLGSRYPETFALVAAIAPDSFFEASLLPEIYAALPVITKLGGISGVRAEIDGGKFMKRRESHTVLNAIAMGLCYAPDRSGGVEWPVDVSTGVLLPRAWARWKAHDPIEFLRERRGRIARLERVLLDVGTRDQFHLQYGARQIRDVLASEDGMAARLDYSEFEGNHFEIGERRPVVWAWLKKLWTRDSGRSS